MELSGFMDSAGGGVFMMKPIGRLALPGVAASPLEVVQIIGGFGISDFL
jgi:hypothetical protein